MNFLKKIQVSRNPLKWVSFALLIALLISFFRNLDHARQIIATRFVDLTVADYMIVTAYVFGFSLIIYVGSRDG